MVICVRGSLAVGIAEFQLLHLHIVECLSEMFLVLDQPCSLAGEKFGGDCGKDGSDAESQ